MKTYIRDFPPVLLGKNRGFGDLNVSVGLCEALYLRQDGYTVIIDGETARELAALINANLELVGVPEKP